MTRIASPWQPQPPKPWHQPPNTLSSAPKQTPGPGWEYSEGLPLGPGHPPGAQLPGSVGSAEPVEAGLMHPQSPAQGQLGLGPGSLSCLLAGLTALAQGHSPCRKGLLGPGPPQLPVCPAPLHVASPESNGGAGRVMLPHTGCGHAGFLPRGK